MAEKLKVTGWLAAYTFLLLLPRPGTSVYAQPIGHPYAAAEATSTSASNEIDWP